MDLFNFSWEQFQSFTLILIRIGMVLFLLPIFGNIGVPRLLKAGIALALTIFLFPVARLEPAAFPSNIISFVILVVSEAIMGVILGLMFNLIFAAAQLAGQLIAFQMGFAVANVIDPQSGLQSSILSQFGYILTLILFLALNGHHWLIRAVVMSFDWVRPGGLVMGGALYEKIALLSGDMFKFGIKLAAPAMAALLFTSIAMGILAKTVPQIHILIVAFPLKIAVGLIFFGISMEMFLYLMRGNFENLARNLIYVLKLM